MLNAFFPFAVIGHANRHYTQGINHLITARSNPIHQLKLENGGIVFARNSSHQVDSKMSYEIKSLSSRPVVLDFCQKKWI